MLKLHWISKKYVYYKIIFKGMGTLTVKNVIIAIHKEIQKNLVNYNWVKSPKIKDKSQCLM